MDRPGGILLALGTVVVVFAALATPGHATEMRLRFASKQPATTTAMTLHIRYTKAGNPKAKPSPIRHIRIDAPAGTSFHSLKVPACRASDSEVRARGTSACPEASRIGDGTVVVVTGFGKPFDPFASPTPVFNDGRGWLEISQTPTAPATIAVTRLRVTGSRIAGNVAPAPGGPPDNETAVSTADITFPASTGYITTPPTCPASGRWSTTGRFTFADGTAALARSTTPCARPARAGARLRLRVTGRRGRAGRRSCFSGRVRATVTGRDRRRARRAVFLVGRRTVARDGRRPLSRVIDRRRHRGASHWHTARAAVRLRNGGRVRVQRRYRVCAGSGA